MAGTDRTIQARIGYMVFLERQRYNDTETSNTGTELQRHRETHILFAGDALEERVRKRKRWIREKDRQRGSGGGKQILQRRLKIK